MATHKCYWLHQRFQILYSVFVFSFPPKATARNKNIRKTMNFSKCVQRTWLKYSQIINNPGRVCAVCVAFFAVRDVYFMLRLLVIFLLVFWMCSFPLEISSAYGTFSYIICIYTLFCVCELQYSIFTRNDATDERECSKRVLAWSRNANMRSNACTGWIVYKLLECMLNDQSLIWWQPTNSLRWQDTCLH